MAKILFVDSYDSYSYNIYQLVLDVIPNADIVVVRNDQLTKDSLDTCIYSFDFVIIGPGPGDPRNSQDVGILPLLFLHDIPILGVCLGFQLLCLYAGGKIERMRTVKHGQVSRLFTKQCPMYPAGSTFHVTRYHSIGADISRCEDLIETAWVEDAADNGHVSMSATHRLKPFVGVQYHPESACSEDGPQLITNFLRIASDWNCSHRGTTKPIPKVLRDANVRPRPLCPHTGHRDASGVEWRELEFVLPAPRIAELMGVRREGEFLLLDAAAEPARYSVIAVLSGTEKHLQYKVGEKHLQYGGKQISLNGASVWHFVADLMGRSKVANGPINSPFWGGLVGYVSYEAGVEALDVRPLDVPASIPDLSMIFVDRSIVVDYTSGRMFVQSIVRAGEPTAMSDSIWLARMCDDLTLARHTPPASPPINARSGHVNVELPDKEQYLAKIRAAQQYLSEGHSYELCLTARTRVRCEPQPPWQLYQTLRKRNPSPFACYMKLPGVHLLSSSPERFISWSREDLCQLRPIKGTVRKTKGMTIEKARTILNDPKEIAENLMIVDLIRHDLHQVAHKVEVLSLMQVEEYETVFQLVSVITGQTKAPFTGLDVFSRSLPPGSMTGAPKKRSVELLQQLEGKRRQIYSGVCGYLSVCGGGDWSVVIRSAFRIDHENTVDANTETWWIGAGGAITALSEPESEWEEMLTKLRSTLPCFG